MNENFNEKIGLNVSEAANMLGISKNLMSELIKHHDFPCIKSKRRSELCYLTCLENYIYFLETNDILPYS